MSANVSGEVKAEPNLTPLLDVVFQLITFFMLVINFTNENYDRRVRLPVVGSARPVEGPKAAEDRLVLNIDSDGHLLINGEVKDSDEAIKEISLQAELVRTSARLTNTKLDEGGGLPTTLVIRADRSTEFALVHRLIVACQTNGFRKFVLKAMSDSGS